ncbi:MAG: LamG domain-containing protein [Desulfobacteraceae bacterium]|nr:LamG domain-containing protein [Desulfobacteraceae bacterium]
MKKKLLLVGLTAGCLVFGILSMAGATTEGLVAGYEFSGNANDSSGCGEHNGAVTNAQLATDRFGLNNSAYSFDGNGDYIGIPNSDHWKFATGDYSIMLWIKPDGNADARDVLMKVGSGYDGSFVITIGPNEVTNWSSGGNKIGVHLTIEGAGSSWGEQFGGDVNVANGDWHHVAVVREGNDIKLFIDGNQNASTTYSHNFTNYPITLGSQQIYNDRAFDGSMDDVFIYNRALNQSQIQNIMNYGLSGYL